MKIFGHIANIWIMRYKYRFLPDIASFGWAGFMNICLPKMYKIPVPAIHMTGSVLCTPPVNKGHSRHLLCVDICYLISFTQHDPTLFRNEYSNASENWVTFWHHFQRPSRGPLGQTTSKISCWILSNQAAWLPVQDWVISHSLLDLLPRIQMSPKTWVCVKQYGWHHPGPKGHCRWHHPRPMCV